MSTPYLGQISMFGGNYAPNGWALCNGQLLAISQYSALFTLVGTTYGGNGTTTFGLPNLQSRLPVHMGTGPGLSPYVLGQQAGAAAVTLTTQNLPNHTHSLNATTALASTGTVGGGVIPAQATGPVAGPEFYAAPVPGLPALTPVPLALNACGPTGSGIPHSNMMPSLCISFIIALVGLFPSRN